MTLRKTTTQYDVKYIVESTPFELPDFQRGEVWDKKKKIGLILSILQGIGFPPLITIKTEGKNDELLLDGLQRFTAIKQFIDDEFKLDIPPELEVDEELFLKVYKKKFSELEEELKAEILNHFVGIIRYEVPKEEEAKKLHYAMEIFKRINLKPTPLAKGHLLYLLTYSPEFSPQLREISLVANYGEDKKWDSFRTLVRYMGIYHSIDQIEKGEKTWKKFYEEISGQTLLDLKEAIENAKGKEKKELIETILNTAKSYEDYSIGLVEYIKEKTEKELNKEFDKLLQEELEKLKQKRLDKLTQQIMEKEKLSEEKAKEKALKKLKTVAREKVKSKISSKTVSKGKKWLPSKKAWIGDFFAVLEKWREEQGEGMKPDEWFKKVGIEAFENLMKNEQFRENINDKKTLIPSKTKERLDLIEKAVEKVVKKLKISKALDESLKNNEIETIVKEAYQAQHAQEQKQEQDISKRQLGQVGLFQIEIDDEVLENLKKKKHKGGKF